LKRIAAEDFDLLLIDVTMPIVDGAEVGLAVRAEPRLAGIPIIMMSARSEASLRERFKDYDEFLRKPFHLEMVREVVKRTLSVSGGE
jgi:CheY-like chemotaxis protein